MKDPRLPNTLPKRTEATLVPRMACSATIISASRFVTPKAEGWAGGLVGRNVDEQTCVRLDRGCNGVLCPEDVGLQSLDRVTLEKWKCL